MTTNKLVLMLFSAMLTGTAFAQTRNELELPSGLGISNQLKYSFDNKREIEIFENWLNLDYKYGIFSAGLRLDVFQPNDPNPAISRGKENYADIAYKYFQIDLGEARKNIKLTAGNFYSSFGLGMILKSYENRDIRIDNNLLGVKLQGRYNNFSINALTGKAENIQAERKDILHAADIEYKFFRQLKAGYSIAALIPENTSAGKTTLQSLRIAPRFWNFDFYGEYGIKQNSEINNKVFNGNENFIGKGIYGSVNFHLNSFGLSGEYKYYDNFAFTSYDGTIFYNTPPSLRKDYSFILLNRHPSPLDANNEQGFQIEATYNLNWDSFVSIAASQTNTLDRNSYYQKINNLNLDLRTQLKEIFTQINFRWNKEIKTIAAFGYNEELSTNTKNISPVFEIEYYPNETNTLKAVVEHMHTTDRFSEEKFYSDIIVLEWLKSPKLSVSIVTEIQTKEPQPRRIVRRVWSFARFGYQLWEHTNLSVLAGTRQAGNICIGGVCRYEPEFSGIEFKMITTL